MLKKDIYLLLVGKNYISTLLALELLEQGRDILLLDDERVALGEHYTDRLFALEKEYLKCWGHARNIEPLINIDSYCKSIPTSFIFDGQRLRLGDTPARNYRELLRKIPQFFSFSRSDFFFNQYLENVEKFNRDYFNYCRRPGERIWQLPTINDLTLETFKLDCPPLIWKLYLSLESILTKGAVGKGVSLTPLITLLYMARTTCQKKLSLHTNPVELFHLLLCLLSPHYQLDQKRFLQDMLQVSAKRGGQLHQIPIREWQFHRKRPWSVELASYEGIIHPQKMAFIGGIPRGNLVSLKKMIKHYVSLNITLNYSHWAYNIYQGERTIFSSVRKLGLDFPLWEGVFHPSGGKINFLVRGQRANKIEFLQDKVEALLRKEIKEIFPHQEDKEDRIKGITMDWASDIWVDEGGLPLLQKKSTLSPPLVKLVDLSHSKGHPSPLKNVYYFGPCQKALFGVLGILMEINNQHKFL